MNPIFYLILFNVINVADKITTYFGINQGFYETNKITVELIQKYGLLNTVLIKITLTIIFSIMIYTQYKKVPVALRNILKYGTFSIIVLYSFALINNIYWLNIK